MAAPLATFSGRTSLAAVRDGFAYHSQRYGTRRLRVEVQAQGHTVGRQRVRRVLREHGLRAQQPRSFVPA